MDSAWRYSEIGRHERDHQVKFTIEHEREEDGRWLAEVPELPGILAYGATPEEAMAKAEVLILRVLAERLEHNEARPQPISIAIPGTHDLVQK